jgi:hypothetical protein
MSAVQTCARAVACAYRDRHTCEATATLPVTGQCSNHLRRKGNEDTILHSHRRENLKSYIERGMLGTGSEMKAEGEE